MNQLTKVLDILSALNSRTNIVGRSSFDEQYENLVDLRKLTDELDALIKSFDAVDERNGEKIEEKLFEFHRILTTFEWHISEVSDLNFTLLEEYKDKINESK